MKYCIVMMEKFIALRTQENQALRHFYLVDEIIHRKDKIQLRNNVKCLVKYSANILEFKI